MIAAPVDAKTPSVAEHFGQVLTSDELYRLTLYKWRYSLEAYGFADDQVRQLLFMKWLCATRRLQP